MKSKRDIRTALRGSMTALVTPFRDGAIDWPAVDHLIDRQIDGGTDWLVPCGTTGESPTLSSHEHDQLLERVIDRASGRCYVLAGTGSNDTADTLQKTKQAAKAGVDAAMLVAPYYNRPSQEGLYQHFAAVAEAVDLPIVGMGGVTSRDDVLDLMAAGASAVGLGTVLFSDPFAPRRIREELENAGALFEVVSARGIHGFGHDSASRHVLSTD